MTANPTQAGPSNLIERVRNILLQPQSEWDKIAAEPADLNRIYVGYVLPLAALAAICGFIGSSLFGISMFGATVKLPIVAGAIEAVIRIVLSLAGVYVLAIIANALAPNFGSRQDMGQAHKLAAYGSTAGFLAGVFAIFPPLAILVILGLYSLALLYIGLPRLMKTPEDKRVGYLATIIVIAIVISVVIAVVASSVQTAMGYGPGMMMLR